MSNVTKVELAAALADTGIVNKGQAAGVLSALFGSYGPNGGEPGIISKHLQKGKKVAIVGFGTFQTSERKARTGRNPQNGQPVEIEARISPAFKPGKCLKEEVNS